MKYENWRYAEIAPASLQYLCDVLDTDLYKAPPGCTEVPEQSTLSGAQSGGQMV